MIMAMGEQLTEIGMRLAALRDACDFSQADMATKLGVSQTEYAAYENGEKDFSFSFLYNAANILGVDVLDIISGETPKLSTCAVVRAGEGYSINRRAAYDYRHLAYTFRDKLAEPFMVTVEPSDEGVTPTLHAHGGQEFNYVVSGEMQLYIGEISYILKTGDSVYFNSAVPHAMRALGGVPTKFLAVVIGDTEDN